MAINRGKNESFLDEAFLRKLETIRILAQKGIKGKTSGIHRSYKSGSSQEFMDYRRYHPGDDMRYVDWSVYGRTDQLFIKLFHAEKDLTLHILVDTSKSMEFGYSSKADYAKKIVAALSYIGLANQDQVGVTSFSEIIGQTKSPERGKDVYLSVLNYLKSLNVEGKTNFNTCLEQFANEGNKPGIVVVISDLLDPLGYKDGLRALIHSKFKLTLIHVLAQEEIGPTFKGNYALQDIETGIARNFFTDKKILQQYEKKMTDYLNDISNFCRQRGIDYHLANTEVPFEDFFLEYLKCEQRGR